MSTAPDNQVAEMTGEQAHQYLFNNIYMPVLLDKCAAAGIHPRNAEEVQKLVDMASVLHNAHEAEMAGKVKTASASLIDICHDRLGDSLEQVGLGHLASARQDQLINKVAMTNLNNDPQLLKAAIAFQNAQATQIASQAAK